MAFALLKVRAYGIEAEECLNKRYKQQLILGFSGLSADVDLTLGDYPTGQFWTDVNPTSTSGTTLIKILREIQLRADCLDWVGGRGLVAMNRSTGAPAAGEYQLTLDPINNVLPNIAFFADDAPNIYMIAMQWTLKDAQAPVEFYGNLSSIPGPGPNPTTLMEDLLGGSGVFESLAATSISNTGTTTVTGDVGLYPGTSVTGFPPGIIIGTLHVNDGAATAAQAARTTAFAALNAMATTSDITGVDLGGLTLPPGVYNMAAGATWSAGALTLDAGGDQNARFVFKTGTTLITPAASSVILAGGAQAENIAWAVGTAATLVSTAGFIGNIFTDTAITLTTGATIVGRTWAGSAVTYDTNTVTH